MKVVLNRNYGGFGLSAGTVKRLVYRGWEGLEVMTEEEYNQGRPESHWPLLVDAGDGFRVQADTPDVLHSHGKVYCAPEHWTPELRSDPVLVDVVETLGEAAGARGTKLRVVEIPDGIDWHIACHDGIEHVAQNHGVWPDDADTTMILREKHNPDFKFRCTWCMHDVNGPTCPHCGPQMVRRKDAPHDCEWSRKTINTVECKVCGKVLPMQEHLTGEKGP